MTDDAHNTAETDATQVETIEIDVISDVMCPWCYIGKRRLEKALAMVPDVAVDVRWRPFQLDNTIPETGMDRQEYLSNKFGSAEQAAQVYGPVRAAGADEKIPFDFEKIKVSPNTLNAHRLIRWAMAEGVQDTVVERLFQLYFIEGANLTDNAVLVDAAETAGLERAVVERLLAGDADITETQAEIAQAQHMGVTGVPAFIIGNRYVVMGAREPEAIAQAIAQVAQERATPAGNA
jgi:predicted DsbA family dithiol-disulfide isomerase